MSSYRDLLDDPTHRLAWDAKRSGKPKLALRLCGNYLIKNSSQMIQLNISKSDVKWQFVCVS